VAAAAGQVASLVRLCRDMLYLLENFERASGILYWHFVLRKPTAASYFESIASRE
jgi:hypothetical protein